MKLTRALVIFGIGLFAIVGQVLLFREFLVSFEGNELGVGAFFGSWFLWIAIGAALVYRTTRLAEFLIKHIDVAVLLYLPAFIAQYILINQARELVGIDPWQLFNFTAMIAGAFVVNAPLSLLTGILFPLACRWVQNQSTLPVSRVYIIESAGSLAGGLGATVMLAKGVSSPAIFLSAAITLTLAVLAVAIGQKRRRLPSAALVVILMVVFAAGGAQIWNNRAGKSKWHKLLPSGDFGGIFQTAQAEYLYGSYRQQFLVMCHGQICETFPSRQAASEITAIHLSQQPKARHILIAGANLLACTEPFLQLDQTEQVTLCASDPEYLENIKSIIPQADYLNDPRVDFISQDIRQLLSTRQNYYDIIILNFPQATTAVLNRFRTVEFYQAVKSALTANGVVGVNVPGGENVMGTELIELGASTMRTLEEVFGSIVIRPGEQSWFIASTTGELSEQPGTLRDRFAAIDGADKIYPPTAVMSLFLPDKIEFARKMYQSSNLPDDLLINKDSRPLSHLYSLLLLGRHSKSPFTKFMKQISLCNIGFFLSPIIILVILRGIYVYRRGGMLNIQGATLSTFNSRFLIFSVGLISLGSEIVLMYLLQSRYGTLYLQVGLIASLFMFGLTLGGVIGRSLVQTRNIAWRKRDCSYNLSGNRVAVRRILEL